MINSLSRELRVGWCVHVWPILVAGLELPLKERSRSLLLLYLLEALFSLFRCSIIDVILTNSMLVEISRAFLTRMMDAERIDKVRVGGEWVVFV